MMAVTVHRGPDDSGLYCSRNVGFGFNRLSIIDVSAGHQPMANDNGTAWIVFNGEIYNFVELRKRLIQAGHQFRTR
jgi:asparagine synthase (glutamine-hydrolysing)